MTSRVNGKNGRTSALRAVIASLLFTASISGCSTPAPVAVQCPKPLEAPPSLCTRATVEQPSADALRQSFDSRFGSFLKALEQTLKDPSPTP